MNEKELLEKIFEFETYASARFDSEARVALAVYGYVKLMKRYSRLEIINGDDKTYPDELKPSTPKRDENTTAKTN